MTGVAALEALGLDASATPDDVQAAFRRALKTAHPDAGGDAGAVRELVARREAALAYLGSLPCAAPGCEAGYVLHVDGWRSVRLPCEACGATGRRFTTAAPGA